MQEDESQSEQEMQPPSERETGESQPEPEQQSTSERIAGESQPRPRSQRHRRRRSTRAVAGESQPRPRSQLPPATPVPLPLSEQQKRWQYFLGLAFGLIPLIVFLILVGFAPATPGYNALGYLILAGLLGSVLYAIELGMTIIYLTNKQRRFVGYGLLTAFLASPVIAFIGCTVILNLIHP